MVTIYDIANPFYPEIAEAVENTVRQHEYQMLLCNTHYDFALGRLQMERLMSRWVDGYIIMGSSMDFDDVNAYFQQGHAIVLCDWQENETPPGIPQARVDFYRAGQLAAEHLLSLGHRYIAVIVDEPHQTLRLEGFKSRVFEGKVIQSLYSLNTRTLELEVLPVLNSSYSHLTIECCYSCEGSISGCMS
jgi:DNA-binding LacI/PurR family transcriptional regulator